MAMHAYTTSAPAADTAFLVSKLSYDDVSSHVIDAQVALSNLDIMLETIAELAEEYEGNADPNGKSRFAKIKRLTWVAMAERDRAEKSIEVGGDALLLCHTQQMRA